MRKFLLWDNDGVLVDTERWYFAATRECLYELGISMDQQAYLGLMSQGCAEAKPADPYLRALARFGASPTEAVAIEDSSRGLRSALAAGLDCAVIRNSFTASQDFTGVWRVLDSVRELPPALAG